jgi:hypothetical protein
LPPVAADVNVTEAVGADPNAIPVVAVAVPLADQIKAGAALLREEAVGSDQKSAAEEFPVQ